MEQQTEQAQEQVKKKNSPLRVVKIIGNIFFYTIVVVVIAVGIIGIVSKFTGNGDGVGLFGNRFYVVATPSMAHVNPDYRTFLEGHDDRIKVGDLIITRSIKKSDDLKMYDVVTFINENKQTIVHRIVQIETGADGKTYYTTRGDSNNVMDGKRTREQLSGILVTNAGHGWGEFVKFIQSNYGIAAITGMIAVILIAVLINDSVSKKGKKKEEKKIDELFDDWKYDEDLLEEGEAFEENEASEEAPEEGEALPSDEEPSSEDDPDEDRAEDDEFNSSEYDY